ncbi:MAG TPA: YqiA/YcfP family alpha/beta fold hydrolase [Aggregicoccus sp.]|nr:YqiA/YcfP family alpha/beta fold hydrolase [Aggregicoccus sp.]
MLLYLHGFASGPQSFKAQRFLHHLRRRGLALEIPALDEGDFERLTLSRQLALIRRLAGAAPRPHVLIGSSMGGYLALLHAAAHPVDALVVMAPAVDFARRWRERVPPAQLGEWERTGRLWVDHHALKAKAPLGLGLLHDAALHAPWPEVRVPTLVLQGVRDEVVPLAPVQQWVQRTPSARLVTYDSDHELTDVADALCEEALHFLAQIPALHTAYPELRAPSPPGRGPG